MQQARFIEIRNSQQVTGRAALGGMDGQRGRQTENGCRGSPRTDLQLAQFMTVCGTDSRINLPFRNRTWIYPHVSQVPLPSTSLLHSPPPAVVQVGGNCLRGRRNCVEREIPSKEWEIKRNSATEINSILSLWSLARRRWYMESRRRR